MRSLAFLTAEVLLAAAMLGPQPARVPDRPALERPAPKEEAKPKYRCTEKTRFFLDGVEVTDKVFLAAEGLVVEEIVADGDEITVLRARTKKAK